MQQKLARMEKELESRFGYSGFREGQREAVEASLANRDLLVVMPTESDKSLCYQLPSVVQSRYVLVVSPFIALMNDQVAQLRGRGISAATFHSDLYPQDKWDVARALEQGALKLLLVTPERFRNPRFVDLLRRTPPRRLVVEEAHCISQWGHDFRPDYRRIRAVIDSLGEQIPVSAFTGAATPEVRRDIIEQLVLRDPIEVVAGFERPNLIFDVFPATSRAEKIRITEEAVGLSSGIRLVYASSRRSVEEIAARFALRNPRVAAYHAGLADAERARIQDAFLNDELEVVVATKAFGLGVDKPDIRLVVHYDMPGSLEAYYQEAGRAGRDGHAARCLLIQDRSAYIRQRFFLENANPSPELIEELHGLFRISNRRVRKGEIAVVTTEGLQNRLDRRSDSALGAALLLFHQLDLIHQQSGMVLVRSDYPQECPIDPETLVVKKERDDHRLARMWEYARGVSGCRVSRVHRYFLGGADESCGRCDLCRTGRTRLQALTVLDRGRIESLLGVVAELGFRVGPFRIAKILSGSRSEETTPSSLHGALREESESSIRDLVQYGEDHGLIGREAFRNSKGEVRGNLLGITNLGRRVLRGDPTAPLRPPPPARAPRSSR